MDIKMKLIDNDYVVRAKTDLSLGKNDNTFSNFLKQIKEELIPGQTAYLTIETSEMEPVKYEICEIE